MSNIVPFNTSQVPAALRNQSLDFNDLSEGVSGGFAVLSFKGSKFRVKHQGEETMILNSDGDPAGSIEAVIIKANPVITKNYYEKGYAEGATEAPDCFSLDGARPDSSAPRPQATTCASCPKNVFGSRITPAGKKAKACQDNRRLAIVPLNDMHNEVYGGPMLLRIPAGSLGDLAQMGKELKVRGFPYNAVAVRISFDHNVAYPKLVFKPVRPLTEEEAAVVAVHLSSDKLERILADATLELGEAAIAPEPAEQPKDTLWADPAAQAAAPKGPAAAPAPAAPAAPAAAAKPKAAKPKTAAPAPAPAAPAPVAEAAVTDDVDVTGELDGDIKSILDGLDLS